MSKKKILYYTDCPFFAGCENMIANFFNSEELSKEFDIVLVYRYSKEYEEGAEKRINDMSRCVGVELITETEQKRYVTSNIRIFAFLQKCIWVIVYIFNKYYSIIKNAKTLQQKFSEYKPDIIHINNGGYPAATSCYAAVLAARKCGVKNVVYMVNNMAMDYSHPLRWFDRRLDEIVKETVTYFINGSNTAGLRLKQVLKLPASQQVTIRNGIIPRKVTMSREDFRKIYSINCGTFVFAEVANLEERKGHRVLLNAVRKLIDDKLIQNFVVLIEGNGPLKEQIASDISDNKLSDVVRMIEVDQIYNLYNAIDVLILPSLYKEDFPNTIIEAMGQGIHAIGTSIAGIPEQIDDHVTGLLITPGDVNSLTNAMVELRIDKNLYEHCKRQAKQKYNENYTAKISVGNYIKLYNSMQNN